MDCADKETRCISDCFGTFISEFSGSEIDLSDLLAKYTVHCGTAPHGRHSIEQVPWMLHTQILWLEVPVLYYCTAASNLWDPSKSAGHAHTPTPTHKFRDLRIAAQ